MSVVARCGVKKEGQRPHPMLTGVDLFRAGVLGAQGMVLGILQASW